MRTKYDGRCSPATPAENREGFDAGNGCSTITAAAKRSPGGVEANVEGRPLACVGRDLRSRPGWLPREEVRDVVPSFRGCCRRFSLSFFHEKAKSVNQANVVAYLA